MRKFLCIALAAWMMVAVSTPSRASGILVMSSQATNTEVTLPPVTIATKVTIQIQGNGLGSRILIKQRVNSSMAWTTMAEYINPTANGKIYEGPGGGVIAVEAADMTGGVVTVAAEAVAGMTALF